MSSSFEELLARDGHLVYRTQGRSMEPMLKQNRDLVIIRVPDSRLCKYDVAMYKRGSKYILHRVIGVKPDHYLIRGDNTFIKETVPDSEVIGVLTGFRRKGKQHDVTEPGYRFYVRFWNAIYPLRLVHVRIRNLLVWAARKMGLMPLIRKMLRKEGAS